MFGAETFFRAFFLWSIGNVLVGAQGMSCLEHKECPAWDTGNVLPGTQGMSCLEHRKCPAWNTRNSKFLLRNNYEGVPFQGFLTTAI